ncbi:MAG: transposase [SAR324 cluster bacterium]|nr:transposase [SAR324 cluster bacterium]
MQRFRVSEYIQWNITEERVETIKYLCAGRPGPNTPSRHEIHSQFRFNFTRNQKAIDKAMLLAGWRIYVVNAPVKELSLNQAISYYRDQWEVEHDIQHWKKGSLPALPLFLRIETRIRGLMFLLTLALQALTLLEFVARRELAVNKQELSGLVPGNPKMKTARPSAERLLAVFQSLHLLIEDTEKHQSVVLVEALSDIQCLVLKLLQIPQDVYLVHNEPKTAPS